MVKCPGCGEDNPPKFRLCGYCGTPLAPAAAPLPVHELRKTVTILFSDLKDSTALGERLDSEALHEVKERYFGAMAAEIRRHGGKIEKYIGDAIMAVFGLPRAHEDDALRAVRAAAGMQAALARVNAELGPRFGVALANRTGVNTGEVVAVDDPAADQKLATGDAVNVAARLEQAAPVGEVYIGEATFRLVRDAVEVQTVEPLALKGKSQPVPAFRLLKVHGDMGHVRRHDTPIVGRVDELGQLRAAWEDVLATGRARLFTLLGDAGVGKTRLARELADQAPAPLLAGRCLPYGDGITFWPLREMLVAAAGIDADDSPEAARARVLACVEDEGVAERLASAAGLASRAFPLADINWAARRFFESLTADGPLVALFDDVHWAEPAFLDLLESLAESVEAPVLLVVTARHELLDVRADFGTREPGRRLVLDPLGDEAAAQVVTHLLGGASALDPALIRRIVGAAEGNPLYVEQMLSMLVENGDLQQRDGRWEMAKAQASVHVPPTIQALLEARLDKLDRTERAAAEPAAVIGLEFERAAVESLALPALRPSVGAQLDLLSRKRFIRPALGERSTIYRFHHHLVRETVYNGLLKRARATMHAEFVKWADQVNAGSDRGREFEEILGYHLEQAYRYLTELGPLDDAGRTLGRDGSRRLASAGHRAFSRGDMHAAAGLLQRAIALLPADDDERLALLPELAETRIGLGDFGGAKAALAEATSAAKTGGNARLLASAQLVELLMRMFTGGKVQVTEGSLPSPMELIEVLQPERAHSELATAWRLVVMKHGVAGQYELARQAAERAVEHARAAGHERLVARIGGNLADFALLGPTPVLEAITVCEKLIADGLADRQAECRVMCKLAQLRAMNGELEVARALYRQARTMLRDLGQGVFATTAGIDLALVELLDGDLALAERELRSDYAFLEQAGETYYLSTMAALLARVLRDQGREAEALPLLAAAQTAAAEDDFDSQALWRSIKAPILARAGEHAEAETLARTAVEMVGKTEAPVLKADALMELAAVLAASGRNDEAQATLAEARARYEAKGHLVGLARCRAQSTVG